MTRSSSRPEALNARTAPGDRPLELLSRDALRLRFAAALEECDGTGAAHCVHEGWMRGDMAVHVERNIELLWKHTAASIPDWMPMHYVHWLPTAYAVARTFHAHARGSSNLYLVLLDRGEAAEPHGVYVGMSAYSPVQRFDQHKAGIRAAGSVLKHGIEVLTGPTRHLQRIARREAARIEIDLAIALADAGIAVKGGH